MIPSITLGLSPGSKVCGIAVFRDGTLEYLKVCTKSTPGLAEVQSVLRTYAIQAVAVMETHPSRGSPATREASERLVTLTKDQDLPVYTCSAEWLRKQMGGRFRNKRELFGYLAAQFPELEVPYHKSLRERNPYWTKLLEAVAVAVVRGLE